MPAELDLLTRALERLDAAPRLEAEGRVRSAVGTLVRATLPGAAVGEQAEITTVNGTLRAEIVGFEDATVLLVPLGPLDGVRPGAQVRLLATRPQLMACRALLGRVLDALGRPLDGGTPADDGAEPWPLVRDAPPALSRQPVGERVETGLRVLDGLLPLGHGQRVGIFSSPGAGKSTLLTRLASLGARERAFDAVVVALVGERGREVASFVDEVMRGESARRLTVFVATADQPAPLRLACAQSATALAEYFRDRYGMRVLLCLDSLTRVARAQREVGLAAGEPPVRQGYPPSLSGLLARLIERTGTSAHGSITAVYTVLTEAGRALEDPVADEVRGLLDGHIVLSDALAARGHFPAIDVLASLSRLDGTLLGEPLASAARKVRALLAVRQARGDLVALGAYRRGQDAELDEALELWPEIEAFLQQGRSEHSTLRDTDGQLRDLADV